MWVITGLFDAVPSNSPRASKWLRPGKSYTVGRKDRPLTVVDRRVSRDHLVFHLDTHNALSLQNITTHNRKYTRGTDERVLAQGASVDLQHGDVVNVVTDVPLTVTWENIVCYAPSAPAACASLGISVVLQPQPDVTHHITPTYSLTPAIASSLLNCARLVKPEWLQALVDAATSDGDGPAALEQEFILPSTAKYRPTFSPSLPSSLKNHRSWEQNEARNNMWAAYRVVFVANETPEEYKTLVKSGGASYECCPVQRTSLHRVLAKAQHKADNTVLIADETVLTAALGQDGWNELVQEAADYGLRFIPREKLIQAVAHVDHSYIDCSLLPSMSNASASLPDVVLNTHPDEHSIPPSLVRRSVPPEASNSQVAELEPPKRKLTRRFTRAKPAIIGIDDPSILEDHVPDAADSVPEPIIDPLARPSRLKRRFGPGGAQTQQPPPPSQLFSDLQSSLARTDEDDSLKKFKSLFEETDPDKIALAEQSQTQRESASTRGGMMSVVREEEEETPASGPVSQGGTKRKAREEGEEEEDLRPPGKRRELEPPPSESSRPTQKSAPESTTAIRKTTTTQTLKGAKKPAGGGDSGRGAAPGKPDTDTAFLKAVASTKRGKKHEDEFDREFNDLRISKPDLRSSRGAAADEARRQWEALLHDFGDDRDVRGNFMVVEEMEVFRKEEAGVEGRASGRGLGVASERVDWDGRLDFKKFKRKGTRERRQPVELFVEDEAGYEVNAQLWKGAAASQSQQRSSNNKNSSQKPPTSQTETQRYGNNNNKNVLEDTDDVILPKSSRSHTRGATQTQQPGFTTTTTTTTSTGRSTTRTAKAKPKSQPLFLESDDDDDDEDIKIALSPAPPEDNDMEIDDDSGQVLAMDEENETPTLRSTGRRTQQQQVAKPKKAGTKKRPAEVLEDSDDGAAFTGFGSSRKRTRR